MTPRRKKHLTIFAREALGPNLLVILFALLGALPTGEVYAHAKAGDHGSFENLVVSASVSDSQGGEIDVPSRRTAGCISLTPATVEVDTHHHHLKVHSSIQTSPPACRSTSLPQTASVRIDCVSTSQYLVKTESGHITHAMSIRLLADALACDEPQSRPRLDFEDRS